MISSYKKKTSSKGRKFRKRKFILLNKDKNNWTNVKVKLKKKKNAVQKLKDSELDELERIARLSIDEAKAQLLAQVDDKLISEKVEKN